MDTLLEATIQTPWLTRSSRADLARILYVEDSEVIRQFATRVLTRSGYSVTTAMDGQEGWEALCSDPFDLLITDNEMPRLTGLELVRQARLEGIVVPIIVASGSLGTFTSSDLQGLQLAATLPKPFAPDKLLSTVRQVLRAAACAARRGPIFSPTIAEVLNHVDPHRSWGINE